METLQRIGKIFFYLALLAVGIYFISNDALLNLLSAGKNSDQGFLVRIALYFKGADTWSLIFFAITFGVAMGAFFFISLAFDLIFKRLARKFPKLNFINKPWADYVIQIPLALIVLMALFIISSNVYVWRIGDGLKADEISDVPDDSPVFVLGTSKYLKSGNVNLYYKYRIDAALELWRSNKVKFFILSGDGVGEQHIESYDETKDMREDLLRAGVPAEKIKIDPYGFNTLNSIARLREEFRLNNIVIVSQNFHTPRALVLCNYYNIESIAYDSKGSATFAMVKKETLQSRPKLIMDILFANMQPRIVSDGEFEYREAFDSTKSNKHVLIVILLAALFFIVPMGYGIYRAKKGAERRKAAIKYSLINTFLSLSLIALVIQVYKNLDVQFIDEIVETTAQVVGMETTKMEEKKLRLEQEKIAQVEPEVAEISIDLPELEPEAVQPVVTNTSSSEFNTVSNEKIEDKHTPVKEVKVENESNNDPFNTAEGNEDDVWNSSAQEEEERVYFDAYVHNGQQVINDGRIRLRLASATVINGIQYPKNYVFECRTILFDNKIIIQGTRIGDSQVAFKNFEDGAEGSKILTKHLSKKGEIILSDGERIVLGYPN